jgi:hypothetical protein
MLQKNCRYGKFTGFYFGKTPAVLVSDYEVLKEVFKREETADRALVFPLHEVKMENLKHFEVPNVGFRGSGLLLSNGDQWR